MAVMFYIPEVEEQGVLFLRFVFLWTLYYFVTARLIRGAIHVAMNGPTIERKASARPNSGLSLTTSPQTNKVRSPTWKEVLFDSIALYKIFETIFP